MNKSLLVQNGSFYIWKEQGISKEAVNFLDRIAWGSQENVYEHRNTAENSQLITNPWLFTITENEKIQGTAVFCNPQVTVAGQPYNYYYIRYFAASPEIRGKGLVKKMAINVMSLVREGETQKTIFVGFIERGNKGSYRVAEAAGYHPIGTIKTVGFSRFFPAKSKRIQRITTETEKKEIHQLLSKQYSGHALVQFDYLFMKDNYFVIRENDTIVAGCQMHKGEWVVKKMPGLMGKIIMKIVPSLPLINKVFNPKKFEFLVFEGIYFQPGKEKILYELFEGLLAKGKMKTALFWMAEKCPWYKALAAHGRLGLMNKFVKNAEVYIMASYKNMTEEEIRITENCPLYAAGFDYI